MGDFDLTRPRFGPFSAFAAQYPLLGRVAGWLMWPVALSVLGPMRRFFLEQRGFGMDSHAYWLAAQGPLEYGRIPGQLDAYLYSPAFLSAVKPLAMLPWPLFNAVWVLVLSVALYWLLWPLRPLWAIPLFLVGMPELMLGNIYLLLAVTAVLAARVPAVWAFAVLTKVAPGIGLLWPALRRDWRALVAGLGTTVLIVVLGYATDSTAWNSWFTFLLENRGGTPDGTLSYIARAVFAVVLMVVAARLQWSFLIAPAMLLASPVVAGISPLVLLLAIPRLSMADGLVSGPLMEATRIRQPTR